MKQVYALLKGVIYTKKRKDGNVMKLKSLAALMMAGVMALGLCACTNSGTPDDSSTPDTSEAANAEPVSITTTESWDLTMEKNASVCRVFLTPCCAGGSVPLSCLWMNLWRLLCFIGRNTNGALSAARLLSPNPTGGNTAPTAPDA